MFSRRTGSCVGLTAALLLAWTAGPGRAADDDAALRKQVLELNQVTGDSTMLGEVRTLTDDPATAKKLLPVAVKLAGEKPSPLNYNAALIMASVARQLKDVDRSVTLYRLCIEEAKKVGSPTKLFTSYGGIIAGYYTAGKYDDSLKACQEFLEFPEEKVTDPTDIETAKYNASLRRAKDLIRHELVQILSKQGKTEEANKIIERMLKADPDDVDALELRALVQQEAGEYVEAAKTYEEMAKRVNDAIDRVKKNTEIKKEDKEAFVKSFTEDVRRYRYIQSSLYIDANQVDKSADILQALLKEEPDNPSYNNDLGYIWADHDKNLDESEKLIRKAIEDDKKQQLKADPELKPDQVKANPAYLDSLGWVLYKEKKYQEALPPLEEAVKESVKARKEKEGLLEIFDHLAEVQIAMGNKSAAVETWKKGIEYVGTSKREQQRKAEVEKKLKANK